MEYTWVFGQKIIIFPRTNRLLLRSCHATPTLANRANDLPLRLILLQQPVRLLNLLPDIKNGKGPIENLYIGSIPKPKATGAQAIVKIKAFGLNRMDLLQREGHYPVPPQAPKTLGVEFSGIIEDVGEKPERGFKVGDEVFGLAYGGAYAE
jgi:hypothetical protein